jgi:hypothetical protein
MSTFNGTEGPLLLEAKPAIGVAYAFADRRNGWYCFAFDAEGNQLGEAVYLYTKSEIVAHAKSMAADLGVKVKRW